MDVSSTRGRSVRAIRIRIGRAAPTLRGCAVAACAVLFALTARAAPPVAPSAATATAAPRPATPQTRPASHPALVQLVVGGTSLRARDFDEALAIVTRSRYYHGTVPPDALPGLRKEAREALIDRTLLLNEARRRGLRVPAAPVERALAEFDRRNAGAKDWRERRVRVKQRLQDDALIDALYAAERAAAGQPTDALAEAYYVAHREQFTEPEKQRVSVILLGVEASAPKVKWDAARAEAAGIVRDLKAGADFTSQAKLRSTDATAASGGDMGYLHRGMLPDAAQQAVDALQPGQVTAPITVLSGVAIFRLEARRAPVKLPFDDVRQRARDLWLRDAQERRADALITDLRARAVIRVVADDATAGA